MEMAADSPSLRRKLFELSEHRSGSRFVYTWEEWQHQFLDRPSKPEVYCVGETFVLVEHAKEHIRILSMDGDEESALQSALLFADDHKKSLQLFTTSETTKELCAGFGFSVYPGYVMASKDDIPSLSLQSGDRI